MIFVWISDLGSFTTSAFNPFLLLLWTIQPVSMVILSLPLTLTVCHPILLPCFTFVSVCDSPFLITSCNTFTFMHLWGNSWATVFSVPAVIINYKLSGLVMVPKRNHFESRCYIWILFIFFNFILNMIFSLYLVFYFKRAVWKKERTRKVSLRLQIPF